LPYIATGISALAGGLANRKQTSTSMPTLDPAFGGMQSDLIAAIQKRMADPSYGTEPLRLGLMEGVNRRYSTLPQRVTTKLAQRGFGDSGQTGAALKGVELARMGEQGDIATKMAELTLGREDSTLDLINRILAGARGETRTGSGNVLGGAIGAGAGTMSMLTMLNKLLKGGGGGVINMGDPMGWASGTAADSIYTRGY